MRYSRIRKLKKRWVQGYVRLVRSPGAPHHVAGGMAVGLFVSMLPIIQMPVAVGVTEALRRLFRMKLSRVAAAAGVFLTNPLTGPVLYGAAFLLGRPFARMLIPGAALEHHGLSVSWQELAHAGPLALQTLTALSIGGALLGIPVAVVGYFVTRGLVRAYQQRRLQRAPRTAPAVAAVAIAA